MLLQAGDHVVFKPEMTSPATVDLKEFKLMDLGSVFCFTGIRGVVE